MRVYTVFIIFITKTVDIDKLIRKITIIEYCTYLQDDLYGWTQILSAVNVTTSIEYNKIEIRNRHINLCNQIIENVNVRRNPRILQTTYFNKPMNPKQTDCGKTV